MSSIAARGVIRFEDNGIRSLEEAAVNRPGREAGKKPHKGIEAWRAGTLEPSNSFTGSQRAPG
jgi:hypothetical protein